MMGLCYHYFLSISFSIWIYFILYILIIYLSNYLIIFYIITYRYYYYYYTTILSLCYLYIHKYIIQKKYTISIKKNTKHFLIIIKYETNN